MAEDFTTRTRSEKLALLLASAIWDDDVLHTETTADERKRIDRIAQELLTELGFGADQHDEERRANIVAALKKAMQP